MGEQQGKGDRGWFFTSVTADRLGRGFGGVEALEIALHTAVITKGARGTFPVTPGHGYSVLFQLCSIFTVPFPFSLHRNAEEKETKGK